MNMLIAALAAFALAGAASAQQQLQMTGEWFSNRGPLVDIPQNGGPQFQSPCNVTDGCIENFKPADGGVPAAGTATVTTNPGGPATIRVPAGIFNQNKVLTPSTNLIPVAPTVVQLQTNFEAFAPGTEVGPGNLPGFADSPDRILRANAWTNQSGRLSPAFAFCPGPVNSTGGGGFEMLGFVTNCVASKNAGGPGAYNGIVQYQGNGINLFGGTMAMLLDNGGFVTVILGTTGGQPLIAHQPIGAPGDTGILRSQVTGGGYALFNTAYLQPGPGNVGFMTDPSQGKITTVGPSIGNIIPADVNFNWGFPHTTGAITVMKAETIVGNPATTTFTAQGTDSRTAAGVGNITLVSGGLTHRLIASNSTPALNIVTMTFTPEPGPTLMLATSLLTIGGLYAFLRRRANG
jgi:hypothetical protein